MNEEQKNFLEEILELGCQIDRSASSVESLILEKRAVELLINYTKSIRDKAFDECDLWGSNEWE